MTPVGLSGNQPNGLVLPGKGAAPAPLKAVHNDVQLLTTANPKGVRVNPLNTVEVVEHTLNANQVAMDDEIDFYLVHEVSLAPGGRANGRRGQTRCPYC
jgi:hypothetical protein